MNEILIRKAKKGDKDAFCRLIDENVQSMYKVAAAYLKNDEDVADAIQDTILSCYENLKSLKQNRYFKTWMIRILINKCKDMIQKKKLVTYTDQMPETPFHEEKYAAMEWIQALEPLDSKYRLVVLLYYMEGFGIREISDILDARYESAEQLDSHMSRMEHRGNMVMGDTRIEALDNSLFDKLQVFDGDISPMLEPDNNAIAIAVSLDDYGNLLNPEYYPKVGDTITATYADDVKYIDSRTGELCNEDTPEEYLQAKLYGARDVEYTVCALVELPNSMGYRYGGIGYNAVLPVDTAQRDSGGAAIPMLYLFDTADEVDEAEAEQYLSKLTAGEFSPLMYESKATARSEFAQFRQMFLLIGGILCAIIGLVGLLNFFNAMMTGILSRRREFAVLQAVGMTPRQLKTMLIYEGLFYAMSSVSVAFVLSLAVGPLAGKMLGSMFWFFEYRFTVLPVLLTIPVFLLLGWLIPCMMYDNAAKCSIVDQLRDAQ